MSGVRERYKNKYFGVWNSEDSEMTREKTGY